MTQTAYPKSETSKYRAFTEAYCYGVGVDIGASGDPVVPTAICCDLPQPYCPPLGPMPIHMAIDARDIDEYFQPESLDYVYSSHLLEDFADWYEVVVDWAYLVKPGGYLVILVPEVDLWKRAIDRGQPPNLNHKHEFRIGDLSGLFTNETHGEHWVVVNESIPDPDDYSLLFVARRKAE